MEQVKKLGPLDQLMDMLPGAGKLKGMKDMQVDEGKMNRMEAIVKSMTTEEKRNPDLLSSSRRKRIALGSGNSIQDVNRFIKQFEDMQKLMKQFSGMMGGNMGKKMKKKFGAGMKFPF
jgi:signal recognition particle subunit SRP54